ncbi:MAG: hypothetical protein ACI8RY_000889 [Urechidicola sp.]|jgi:hypothetical protein|tara:strand:+ start:98 stop:526 length:429 start_codon:yes stop_codon:yes gene_type:complete
MNEIQPQQIFLIIWLIFAITFLSVAYIRGKKALAVFPNLDTVKVNFREKFVSGRSHSALGGGNNVLDIIITNEELWIKCPIIFAAFGKTFDIIHRINLVDISNIELVKKKVVISFKSRLNKKTIFDLKMKKSFEFIEIIKKK